MTRLTPIDPAAPSAAKPLLDAVHRKLGVVPNMMRVLAANPAVLSAYLGFSDAVTHAGLGIKLHEQIALAVAEANGCDYCLAAHAALGKLAGLPQAALLSARKGEADDARASAVLTLARRLVDTRGDVPETQLAEARAVLTDGEIVEVIASVALNVFTNYLNIAVDTDIDFPRVADLRDAA
jgi:uncharacterized peroxidase-related enzyme